MGSSNPTRLKDRQDGRHGGQPSVVQCPHHQGGRQQDQEGEVERQADPGEDHQPEVQGRTLQLAPAEVLQPLCLHRRPAVQTARHSLRKLSSKLSTTTTITTTTGSQTRRIYPSTWETIILRIGRIQQ